VAAPGATERFDLRIAGVEFAVRGAGCLLEPNPEESYRGFLGTGPGAPDLSVPVLVRADAPFPLARMERAFSTADVWTLWRDPVDGGRYLQLHPEGPAAAAWAARLGEREVEVRCASPFARRAGDATVVWDPLHYPADQLLLAHYLAGAGLLVHAGAAVHGARAVVFAGVSGAGKSTLSRILAAAGFTILSDDRVVLRTDADPVTAWGTPWPGEGEHARNAGAPAAALLLLEHAPSCELRPLPRREALARLLPALSLPWHEAAALDAPLAALGRALDALPALLLRFSPEPAAADLLRRLLDATA